MPIDTATVAANAVQGRPSTTRLMAYLLLAGLLMLLDQRGQFIPRFRDFSEQLIAPLYRVAEAPVEAVRGISTYGRSYEAVLEQNRQQGEQLLVQAGEMQRIAALEEENRRLRALLEASAGRDVEFRFAELVQVSLDPYSHQVLIDRGADDGVFDGQAVIDGQGVMGQVENVTGGQARVRLISDPEHAIPVQILRTGQRTVAMGTGEAGRLSLPNLPIQSDVREGDVLVTSGLGERFPAGFPVAEVSEVDRDTGETFMDVDARPLAALDRGREVLLLLPMEPAPLPAPGTSGDVSGAVADDPPAEPVGATDETAPPQAGAPGADEAGSDESAADAAETDASGVGDTGAGGAGDDDAGTDAEGDEGS